jgi:hypothetical protein
MKNYLVLALGMLLFVAGNCYAQGKAIDNRSLNEMIDQNFKDADAQYRILMRNLPQGQFPKTFEGDTLRTSGSDWWCSGFYPGSLLLIYEQTKDTVLYDEAKRILGLLAKEQYNTTTHDLGFMMYCSFGNAFRLDPNDEYKNILINSARSLATRFNPIVGCIRSWNSKPDDFIVIIDNMMNLELLFWAAKETGDSSLYKIAVTHANTTMKNHYRADYSSYHVLNYDPQTGQIKQRKTAQGAADSSAWARGQSWGLYGYTIMYRETKDKKYLDQANHIAAFLLNNRNLPADKIPYWDYDAPGIPNALRDASAAAIMASALIELSGYTDKSAAKEYMSVAKTILHNLSSGQYKATGGTNGGFILKHSVGSMPQRSEIDVPLTYADYYFLEAMKRYKEATGQN